MGDAISHAVLPGVALSYIFGVHFFVGAIFFGILASMIITYIANNSLIKSDTAIGITFSSFLALGVILIGVANSSTDLFHILFGNVLAVQDSDKWLTIAIAILVLAVIILFFRPLLITSFDPMMAKAFGMKVQAFIDVLVDFGFSDSDAKRRNDLDRGSVSHSSSNGLSLYKTIEAYDGHRRGFRWFRFIYRLVYRVQL